MNTCTADKGASRIVPVRLGVPVIIGIQVFEVSNWPDNNTTTKWNSIILAVVNNKHTQHTTHTHIQLHTGTLIATVFKLYTQTTPHATNIF